MSSFRPSAAWLVAATAVAVLAAGCTAGDDAPDDTTTATRALPDPRTTTDAVATTHDQQVVTTQKPDEDRTTATGRDADTTTATVEPTSTAAEPDTTERTGDAGQETATPAGDYLPAGAHHGYLSGLTSGTVEGQRVSIVGFDEVDFLTGQEATDAARDAGVIGPDEESVPNDYFIRNDDAQVRQVPVIPDSQVYLLDGGSPDLVPGSIEEAVTSEGLFEVQVVVVRGVSLITGVQAVYLP